MRKTILILAATVVAAIPTIGAAAAEGGGAAQRHQLIPVGRVDASLSRVVAGDIQAPAQHGKLAAEAGLPGSMRRCATLSFCGQPSRLLSCGHSQGSPA